MDSDTLRYIMGAMVAAIVHLYFESRNCRNEHAGCREAMVKLTADAAELADEIKKLKEEITHMKTLCERRAELNDIQVLEDKP